MSSRKVANGNGSLITKCRRARTAPHTAMWMAVECLLAMSTAPRGFIIRSTLWCQRLACECCRSHGILTFQCEQRFSVRPSPCLPFPLPRLAALAWPHVAWPCPPALPCPQPSSPLRPPAPGPSRTAPPLPTPPSHHPSLTHSHCAERHKTDDGHSNTRQRALRLVQLRARLRVILDTTHSTV